MNVMLSARGRHARQRGNRIGLREMSYRRANIETGIPAVGSDLLDTFFQVDLIVRTSIFPVLLRRSRTSHPHAS